MNLEKHRSVRDKPDDNDPVTSSWTSGDIISKAGVSLLKPMGPCSNDIIDLNCNATILE
ncbi:hypothetical protein AB5N19_03421 [Seiridium cardinale]